VGIVIALVLVPFFTCQATPINGVYGESQEYDAGWLNPEVPQNFQRGDLLYLTIGGTAKYIVVQLLPEGETFGTPAGVLPGTTPRVNNAFKTYVPSNRIVRIRIDSQHRKIVQIVVHGGQHPFAFPLGKHNGPATLLNAERIP
jgi:hypothetical protein